SIVAGTSPPHKIRHQLDRCGIAEMLDDAIEKCQSVTELHLGHLASRSRVQRLIKFYKTFFDVPENGGEHVSRNGPVGITSTKLYQRGHNSQATQATQLIGVVEDAALYGYRFPFFGC